MTRWIRNILPPQVQRRAARRKLLEQMLPLIEELSLRHGYARHCANRPEFSLVEVVASRRRFLVYRTEVCIDRQARRSMRREALELGVMPVSLGLAAQHGLCKQGLSPQRYQTLWVEILRMQ